MIPVTRGPLVRGFGDFKRALPVWRGLGATATSRVASGRCDRVPTRSRRRRSNGLLDRVMQFEIPQPLAGPSGLVQLHAEPIEIRIQRTVLRAAIDGWRAPGRPRPSPRRLRQEHDAAHLTSGALVAIGATARAVVAVVGRLR